MATISLSSDNAFEELSQMEFFNGNDIVSSMNNILNITRAQRIRAAMFPETLEEGIQIPNTKIFTKQETAVEKLSIPSQLLKEAIRNLINYQDDADVTTEAMPELLLLLNSNEQVTVARAAMMVHELTKKEASRNAIISNVDVMKALLQTVANSENTETVEHAIAAINKLAHHEQGLLAIFQSGGIPILVRMLASNIKSVVSYAISTLRNLMMYVDGALKEVQLCGGIQNMVPLLDGNDVKFLAIVVDCLRLLAHSNQERKLIILACGGHVKLVKILLTYDDYEKLLWVTVRALKVLSVCSSNKPAIVEVGGMQAIGRHLQHPSPRLRQNCLYTMSNISDAACRIDGLENILHILIQFLNDSDPSAVSCSIDIISNITCNNAYNKGVICQMNGVEMILGTLAKYQTDMNIVESAIRALRHLTSRHKDENTAQEIIRVNDGIPLIAGLLNRDSVLPVTRATIELIINLLQFDDNLTPLFDNNVPSRIETLLIRSFEVFKNGLTNDDVSVEVLFECSLNALHIFARNSHIRKIMSAEAIIPILVQLLGSNTENIQRYSIGFLCEMAQDNDGIQIIGQTDAVDILTELMEAHNELISPYAAMILYKLSRNKSPNYRQQLRSEIKKYPQFVNEDLASPDVISYDVNQTFIPEVPTNIPDEYSGEYTYNEGYSSIPTETDSTDFEYMKPDDTRIEITQTIGISDAKL